MIIAAVEHEDGNANGYFSMLSEFVGLKYHINEASDY